MTVDKVHGHYQEFEKALLKNGKLVAKSTDKGFWGVSSCKDVFEVFKAIDLQSKKNFLDLGSGDGRVVMVASLFGVDALGIEDDSWLVDVSLHAKRKLNLPNAIVKFLKKDFHDHDLSSFDVIYCQPDKPFFRGLEQKLKNELKGTLIVHGHEFQPQALTKEREIIVNTDKFCLYTN